MGNLADHIFHSFWTQSLKSWGRKKGRMCVCETRLRCPSGLSSAAVHSDLWVSEVMSTWHGPSTHYTHTPVIRRNGGGTSLCLLLTVRPGVYISYLSWPSLSYKWGSFLPPKLKTDILEFQGACFQTTDFWASPPRDLDCNGLGGNLASAWLMWIILPATWRNTETIGKESPHLPHLAVVTNKKSVCPHP